MQRILYFGACASLLTLVFLCLGWELWLAPLRPGGSWMVLKALPLLAPLLGVLNGRRYTCQWASMLILAYFAEGVARAASENGTAAALALGEAGLAAAFFICAVFYVRLGRPQ